MAGIGLLGFLGGASGQALDAMKSRQDDEREDRKLRMLEELRRDTAVFLADYKEKLDADKVDDKLSGYDDTTQEFIGRNSKGDELFRRKDPGMAQDYKFKRDSQTLQLDAARANIDQSRASAEASRASAARSRQGASLDKLEFDRGAGAGTEAMGEEEAARELIYQNKEAVAQARAAGVPQAKLHEVARLAVANAKSPNDANRFFMDSLYYYTTPDANAARMKLKQKSLDDFGVATGR